MRTTPTRTDVPRLRTTNARLKALTALRDTACERLDRSAGFLASVDPGAIEAFRAADVPEVLGMGPARKRG